MLLTQFYKFSLSYRASWYYQSFFLFTNWRTSELCISISWWIRKLWQFYKVWSKINADALSFQISHWSHESYSINSAKNTHWEAMLRIMAAKLAHLIQNTEMIGLLVTESCATCQFQCWWWIWELADRLTQIVSTNICSHFLPRWHHQPSRSLQYISKLKVNSTCICHTAST